MVSVIEESTFGGVPIMPIESAESIGVCMSIYGAGGVGKTTIVGKAAERHGPMLYIDAEGGAVSIRHLPNIQLAQITKFTQVESLIRALRQGNHQFKSLCLDNMSEMQSLCLSAIVPDGQPQIQHFGQLTTRMLKLTRDCRELSRTQGIHVFLIAWERVLSSSEGIVSKHGVKFTPSFAEQFPGIINSVGYMTPIDRFPNIRKLSFQVSTKTDAKFRVSPGDTAAKIPLELFIKEDSNPLADIVDTVVSGKQFPSNKYAAPQVRT